MIFLVEETEEHTGRVSLAYGTPLTAVSSFRYLGQELLSTNNKFLAVERKLRRMRRKLGWLTKILGRDGADKTTAWKFYVAVV